MAMIEATRKKAPVAKNGKMSKYTGIDDHKDDHDVKLDET